MSWIRRTTLFLALPTAWLAASLSGAPVPDRGDWFAFAPPSGPAGAGEMDLRHLNERRAGEHGRVVARDGGFRLGTRPEAVRFWGVNGPPSGLRGDALRRCMRDLAGRGVNLLRWHSAVFDGRTGELDAGKVSRIVEVVAAAKEEGIYTLLSIYFPLWFRPGPDVAWLPGYDGAKHPFAALMFQPAFEARYREWWRAVLNASLPDGTPLHAEPAVFALEVQNEDSFFFWTFSEANLPEPQLRLLEGRFAEWLVRRHGSLDRAFAAWDGLRVDRDRPDEGRVAFRPLWEVVNRRTARDRDTVRFLYETQAAFYERTVGFFRELGYTGMVTASNWATASPEYLGPLEKMSYLAGDFIDRHGYFAGRHTGEHAAWSIREGHRYADRSALRFDPETPGQPRAFQHPAMDIEYNGRPSMISETTWNRPNRYRGEAPLFYAVYGALQDSDAIVHFALDGAAWSVKPGFFMQPWTLMAPTQMGQFPAAAFLFRRGLIRSGEVVADLTLGRDDLLNLGGTPLPQDAAFDELRLRDVPADTAAPQPGQRLDPLLHLAGRARVTFADRPEPPRLARLGPWIDREAKRVRSTTGEVELDYGLGVLRCNAPMAQGASGNLGAAGAVRLRDVTLESGLDVIHILLVALDEQPLAASRRILLQVMSEEQPTGWRTVPDDGFHRIESLGTDPWRVRRLAGTVRLHRPDSARMEVVALDPSGGVRRTVSGGADPLRLEPDVTHYLIRAVP